MSMMYYFTCLHHDIVLHAIATPDHVHELITFGCQQWVGPTYLLTGLGTYSTVQICMASFPYCSYCTVCSIGILIAQGISTISIHHQKLTNLFSKFNERKTFFSILIN